MMSREQFEQIVSRLDTLIKITAINAFQGKSRADVVRILSELGFKNKDIAMILGTTTAYVAKVKYEFKKQRKKEEVAEKSDKKEAEQR
ncbi:MAG: hypothetical protein QXQ94_06315 [Candidatus Bathyarchaeia archaeon]